MKNNTLQLSKNQESDFLKNKFLELKYSHDNSIQIHNKETYVKVNHNELINRIINKVPNSWKFQKQNIAYARNKNQIFGTIDYKIMGVNDFVTIGFRNSYDKSLAVGLCIGLKVEVCSNLMFVGDLIKTRRHTINVLSDLDPLIENIISYAEKNIIQLNYDMNIFQKIPMDKIGLGRIVADSLDKNIISSKQAGKIMHSWVKGDYSNENGLNSICKARTLYSLYQAFTDALKSCHPSKAITKYKQTHKYFKSVSLETINI